MLHTSRKGPEEPHFPAKGLKVEGQSLLSPDKAVASEGESLLSKSTSRQGTEDMECNACKGQNKKAHFDEPDASKDCKDPTSLKAEDANNTCRYQRDE